jgi:hypothetical protein
VREMVRAYDKNPSPMLARPSAPKRATQGRQIPAAGRHVRDGASSECAGAADAGGSCGLGSCVAGCGKDRVFWLERIGRDCVYSEYSWVLRG